MVGFVLLLLGGFMPRAYTASCLLAFRVMTLGFLFP